MGTKWCQCKYTWWVPSHTLIYCSILPILDYLAFQVYIVGNCYVGNTCSSSTRSKRAKTTAGLDISTRLVLDTTSAKAKWKIYNLLTPRRLILIPRLYCGGGGIIISAISFAMVLLHRTRRDELSSQLQSNPFSALSRNHLVHAKSRNSIAEPPHSPKR